MTNAIFSKALAKLYGYSIWLPNVPGFILKLLLGEMSSIVLNGNRISSAKIEKEGFVFNYPNLGAALQNGIKK
jgi:NAD dependent epimerase/dehydratase family enzyme